MHLFGDIQVCLRIACACVCVFICFCEYGVYLCDARVSVCMSEAVTMYV